MTASRLFRRLLRLLPFDFRADYGREMEQVFREQHRDAANPVARTGVWLRALADLFTIGPREHLSQLRQDLRYAVRGMLRDRGFVTVVVLALALGVGANTAIFSVVHAVLLRPLPYADPDRIVAVSNRWDGSAVARLSEPEYLDYSEQTQTMTLAALSTNAVNITGDAAESERVTMAGVTPNFFAVVGVRPFLGRPIEPRDAVDGRDHVVVLTHAVWQRRYNADPAILGRTLLVSGEPCEVIGVMPAAFLMPADFGSDQPVALLMPQVFDAAAPRNRRGGHFLAAVGRLHDGAGIAAARADMGRVIEGLKRQYPEEHSQGNFAINVESLRTELLGPARPLLFTLAGAVCLVMLIACANVANLLLARAEARRREIAVRIALGASRFRIVRQLLTESLLLALVGAGLGLGVAAACQRVVVGIDPATLPRVADLHLNGPVLAFTLGLAIVTAAIFGLVPAIQLARLGSGALVDGGSRGAVDSMRSRTRSVLVVAQVAVAVVLVVAAGLLIRTFVNLTRVPAGLQADHVLTLRLSPPPATYPGQGDIARFFAVFLDRVRALPGVRSAGGTSALPLSEPSGDWSFDVEGRPLLRGGRHTGAADWFAVTPGYFDSLRVPLVRGRLPSAADDEPAGDNRAIFLNETAARQFFPDDDAIGHRLKLSGLDQPWRTVAGVVGDIHHRGLASPVRPEMFIPLGQFKHFSATGQARGITIVVRTQTEPTALVPAVRAALRKLDPEIPPARVRDMTSVVAASMADRRLNMVLMGSFGALALTLAAIGVYGVMAYQVVKRTREMGVRLALGASADRVRSLVIADGMRLVGIGLALGLVISIAAGGLIQHLLFATGARDLPTLAAAVGALAAAGFVACVIPARRATQVDPMTALRAE